MSLSAPGKALNHWSICGLLTYVTLSPSAQLTAVVGGDDDAVGHHPDFNRHPVGKSRLFQCCHAKAAPGQAPEVQGAVPSPAGDAGWYNAGEVAL